MNSYLCKDKALGKDVRLSLGAVCILRLKHVDMTPMFQNIYYLNLKEISASTPQVRDGDDSARDVFVEIPSQFNVGCECIRVVPHGQTHRLNAYYTYSQKFAAEYLAAVFNSHLGMRFLVGAVNKRKRSVELNVTDVIKVPIFAAPKEMQEGIGKLQMLIQYEYDKGLEKGILMGCYQHLALDLFEDVRDGLILQFYFADIFQKRGIRLWESWAEILSRHSLRMEEEDVYQLFLAVRNLSSPVREAMKRIQVLRNSPDFEF